MKNVKFFLPLNTKQDKKHNKNKMNTSNTLILIDFIQKTSTHGEYNRSDKPTHLVILKTALQFSLKAVFTSIYIDSAK